MEITLRKIIIEENGLRFSRYSLKIEGIGGHYPTKDIKIILKMAQLGMRTDINRRLSAI